MGQQTEKEERGGWKFPGFGVLEDVRELAAKLPSEQALTELLSALPRLERLLNSPAVANMPNPETLEALVSAMPDKSVLIRLTAALEKLPPAEEMKAMLSALTDLQEFMSALKGQ